MQYCDACGNGSVSHFVEVELTLVGGAQATRRRKHATVRLCQHCEQLTVKLFTRDVEVTERIAKAITSTPRIIYRNGGQ